MRIDIIKGILIILIVLLAFLVIFVTSNCQTLVNDRDLAWQNVISTCSCACSNLNYWWVNNPNLSIINSTSIDYTGTFKS